MGYCFNITSVAALHSFAAKLAALLPAQLVDPFVIYLQGELGVGKTTFVRGFLRYLGYLGPVKSPTFNLFEIYQLAGKNICHFDLYRIVAKEELEFLGIRDYFTANSICFIEWPELGAGVLPAADLLIEFKYIPRGLPRDKKPWGLPRGRSASSSPWRGMGINSPCRVKTINYVAGQKKWRQIAISSATKIGEQLLQQLS